MGLKLYETTLKTSIEKPAVYQRVLIEDSSLTGHLLASTTSSFHISRFMFSTPISLSNMHMISAYTL